MLHYVHDCLIVCVGEFDYEFVELELVFRSIEQLERV
jgi:hypothetical protein